MAWWVAPAVAAGVGITTSAVGAYLESEATKKQKRAEEKERRRRGRVLASGYRDQADDHRRLGLRSISDIQRFGNEFLGEQTASYATMGGRIRGESAFLSQEEVDIPEFDTEGYRSNREAQLRAKYEKQIRKAKEGIAEEQKRGQDEPTREEKEYQRQIREAEIGLKHVERDAKRDANKAEEEWGVTTLANMDLPDLTEAIDRRVREGRGSLIAVQNQALEQLEVDILRVWDDTRRGMVKSYKDAREARKSGETVGGDTSHQTQATILGIATNLADTYFRFKMASPDM